MEVKATVKIIDYSDKVKDVFREAVRKGILDGAYKILEFSKDIVPHDEGNLEASGDVTQIDDGSFTTYIHYGLDLAAPYAIRQHEETTWKHQRGRQAKYLETPFDQNRQRTLLYIQRQIKLKTGGNK